MSRCPKSPCLDCKKRVVGCHGKCPDYAKFVAKRERIRRQRRKEWDVDDCEMAAKKRIGWRRG